MAPLWGTGWVGDSSLLQPLSQTAGQPFTNHRAVLGFPPGALSLVWGRLLAQHSEKLKLLLALRKPKFCGRGCYRREVMKKMGPVPG